MWMNVYLDHAEPLVVPSTILSIAYDISTISSADDPTIINITLGGIIEELLCPHSGRSLLYCRLKFSTPLAEHNRAA